MKKLKYIKDNLLNFPNDINVILHCANCQNTMGSGIAKQIKERYPEAYEADTRLAKTGGNKLGAFSSTSMKDTDSFFPAIINLYGQNFYGVEKRQLDYEAIYTAMSKVAHTLDQIQLFEGGNIVVGIPYKMGCDRAGGDWRIVEQMIQVVFEPYKNIDVIIVELDPAKL